LAWRELATDRCPGPTLIDTPLQETQAARVVARLLAADAAMRAHDGDLDGALDSCRAILNTARSIGDEPFVISQLVRVAIGSLAMKSTRRVLGQGEPSDAALLRLIASIVNELDEPLLLYGMKGERATLTELIRRLGTGEVSISALGDVRTPMQPDAFGTKVAPWGRFWYDNQRAAALEWLNEAVAIARRPVPERPALWDAWQGEYDRVRSSRLTVFTEMLPLLLMPPVGAANSAFSRYHGELGSMVILLAAERKRRKTGTWPASIEGIEQEFLPRPPVDPFSGQAFRMEHRDGQVLIYSIGPNHEDEYGAYDPKMWRNGRLDDVGAIGWDVNLRRQPAPQKDEEPTSDPPP
jgi:hypothetical protein